MGKMRRDIARWLRDRLTPDEKYAIKLAVFGRDGWTCWLCGYQPPEVERTMEAQKAANKASSPNALSADHVIPFSVGGKYEVDNLRTACRKCNQDRGTGIAFLDEHPRILPVDPKLPLAFADVRVVYDRSDSVSFATDYKEIRIEKGDQVIARLSRDEILAKTKGFDRTQVYAWIDDRIRELIERAAANAKT